jgi:hypothetical protein
MVKTCTRTYTNGDVADILVNLIQELFAAPVGDSTCFGYHYTQGWNEGVEYACGKLREKAEEMGLDTEAKQCSNI